MSPEVSVRVLSVHTTVVEPRDSTAGRRRTMARRCAMRRTPTARAIVATAGSASCTAATASAIAVSSTSPSGTPWSAERRHKRCHGQSEPHEPAAESIQATFEGRRLLANAADEDAYASKFSGCARACDQHARGAGHHGGALVNHVSAVCERRGHRKCRGVLRHGKGFARECRLVGAEVGLLDDASIGWDVLAGIQLDEVAGYELMGINGAQMPGPHDECAGHVELKQCGHRTTRSQLGGEAHSGVDRENGGNRQCFNPLAEEHGDHRRSDQQRYDHAAQLVTEDLEGETGLAAARRFGPTRMNRRSASSSDKPDSRDFSRASKSSTDSECIVNVVYSA